MPAKPPKNIKFRDSGPFSGRMPLKVHDDRDGRLRIFDEIREGWVDKADFVPVRDAPAYFNSRVQANPKDTWALQMRGVGWMSKGELDRAIKDFDECIRLDPMDATSFHVRGNVWRSKNDYDRAIKDYTEAIRLDPKYARAFRSRGFTRFYARQYDKAANDLEEVIRLDPKEPYAVIVGHFAARRAADDAAAKRFLNDSGNLRDSWPLAVVRFLRGQIEEPQLLKLADDNDKKTEAHCYLGLDHALKGSKEQALAHFLWVRVHGTAGFVEYIIAMDELTRLKEGE